MIKVKKDIEAGLLEAELNEIEDRGHRLMQVVPEVYSEGVEAPTVTYYSIIYKIMPDTTPIKLLDKEVNPYGY